MQITHSRPAGGKRGKGAAGAARGREQGASGRRGCAGAGDRSGLGDQAVGTPARVNLYDEVTARIIAELEAGRVPWVQPWGRVDGASAGLPRNALTGRSYSGINVLILWGAVIGVGYPSQGWLTFKQALEAGGCVRKGERGTSVVYADRFIPEAEKARAVETGGDARAIPFLKRFTVFNVAQCDGLPESLSPSTILRAASRLSRASARPTSGQTPRASVFCLPRKRYRRRQYLAPLGITRRKSERSSESL